jgi:hypothetical protein
LCLEQQSLDELIRKVFVRVMTRQPNEKELATFKSLLNDGYDSRIMKVDAPKEDKSSHSIARVSWSNHLSPEATKIKLEMERAARAGDPPTARLNANWRERMEDMLWALVNSPEFVFVP